MNVIISGKRALFGELTHPGSAENRKRGNLEALCCGDIVVVYVKSRGARIATELSSDSSLCEGTPIRLQDQFSPVHVPPVLRGQGA